jgi:hypothetical protein
MSWEGLVQPEGLCDRYFILWLTCFHVPAFMQSLYIMSILLQT